jgi:hypothetical protein
VEGIMDIYGLVFLMPDQKKIIDGHCFGTCKKIIVGGIHCEGIGPLMVCRTPSKDCPQFDKEMDESIGEVDGDPVFIRKLKA